jgi:hypothetical protein
MSNTSVNFSKIWVSPIRKHAAVGGKDPQNIEKRKIWAGRHCLKLSNRYKNKKHISFLAMRPLFLNGVVLLIPAPIGGSLLFVLRESEKVIRYSDLLTIFPEHFFTKLWRGVLTQNLTRISSGKAAKTTKPIILVQDGQGIIHRGYEVLF